MKTTAPAAHPRKRYTPLPSSALTYSAYLQHGSDNGPFLTERLALVLRNGVLRAWWHETLRPIHSDARGKYIIGHDGERITLTIIAD